MYCQNHQGHSLLWFLQCSLLFSWSRGYASTVPRASEEPDLWWQHPFGMLQTNLREIDGDMDVDEVADYIQEHGAVAWLIGVGGIQANYPTNLEFHVSNPLLSRRESGDLVGDAFNATKARGMRLLARMDFSKIAAEVANEHPDWLYRSPTGELQNHTHGLVSVCPSGEYYQERIFDILNEVTDRYHVDGFFVNWAGFNEEDYYKVYHGVCHCENCQRRWKDFGNGDIELPDGPEDPTYPQWLNFSGTIIDEWTGRVQAFIAEKLPDAGLILGNSAAIMFHEANNAIGRELWPHRTSEAVSAWKSYRPQVPVLVNAVSFMDMPYRMGSEEPLHFAQYFLQCLSRGGNPSTYIMGVPGKIPYLALDMASQITRFHKTWSDVYDGLHPVAKFGLVRPDESQMNGTEYDDAVNEFRGLYKALQELHLPFDVIAQENIEAMADNGGLERYEVVILPDLHTLSSADVSVLDEWVADGGNLIATGSSGIDEDGTAQFQSLPANRSRNVISKPELLWSSYFAPPQNRTQENYYTGPIVPVYGTYYEIEWKEGTNGTYKYLPVAPFSPPEYAYGNVQVDIPGSGSVSYKNGKGLVIPFTVGRGYYELGLRVFRDFFDLILEQTGVLDKLSFSIAEQVEVTVNANGPRTIVHLINQSGLRRQNFGSYLPIPAGSIRVSGGNVTARALRSDRLLHVKDGIIELPGLDLFEVVVIEGLD